ncbi:MAG: diguanylate cyclase [Magnetococcales bacterium]|nr:diguanylate cyclase [Magnetococcales bacterium]
MKFSQTKKKILIVDDEPINIAILQELLSEDHETAIARNGREALELVPVFRPDMILLDVMMPELDGYTVCQRLKRHSATRGIAVIFVTAKTESEDVARGMALGALDYIGKPFRPAIIKARIRSHVERMEAQHNLSLEMKRDLKAIQSRLAISALLETSLEPLPLQKQLTVALDIILTIPWLAVEYKGSIHLFNPETNLLELVAHRNLAPHLLRACGRLKMGQCLCGLAAQKKEIVFKHDLDAEHTVTFAGIHPHGHYCTPILFQDHLLGVLNLYVSQGHERSPEEDALLATLANTLAGIIRHRKTELALLEERQFISAILETTSALVAVLNPDGAIVRFNAACELLTGLSAQSACGRPFWDPAWTLEGDVEKIRETVMMTAQEPATVAFFSRWTTGSREQRFVSWTLTVLQDDGGEVKNFIATGIDVTQQMLAQQSLERLAHYDPLTGLPNRRLFTVFLQQAMARSRRRQGAMAVLFMDLDRFKSVNDHFGHDIGDLLLSEAAQRIRSCLRENDIVARLGGDEFTIILSEEALLPETIGIVAQKIIDGLSAPFYLNGHTCHIGASIGVSLFPADGEQPEELLKRADQALYAVKKGGRNHYLMYQANMESEVSPS